MAHARGRKRVTWNSGSAPPRQSRPHPHLEGREFPEEYSAHMVVGSLWIAGGGACIVQVPRAQPHELPYVVRAEDARWYSASALLPPGATAVYMGTTRVAELSRSGHMLQVLRHTFLAGGTRVMVFEPHTFRPAAMAD